jgi:hypothetical protein
LLVAQAWNSRGVAKPTGSTTLNGLNCALPAPAAVAAGPPGSPATLREKLEICTYCTASMVVVPDCGVPGPSVRPGMLRKRSTVTAPPGFGGFSN